MMRGIHYKQCDGGDDGNVRGGAKSNCPVASVGVVGKPHHVVERVEQQEPCRIQVPDELPVAKQTGKKPAWTVEDDVTSEYSYEDVPLVANDSVGSGIEAPFGHLKRETEWEPSDFNEKTSLASGIQGPVSHLRRDTGWEAKQGGSGPVDKPSKKVLRQPRSKMSREMSQKMKEEIECLISAGVLEKVAKSLKKSDVIMTQDDVTGDDVSGSSHALTYGERIRHENKYGRFWFPSEDEEQVPHASMKTVEEYEEALCTDEAQWKTP